MDSTPTQTLQLWRALRTSAMSWMWVARAGGLERDAHAKLMSRRGRQAGIGQAPWSRISGLGPPSPPWAPHGDSGNVSTAPTAHGLRQRLAAGSGTGWRDTPPPACTPVSHAPLHHAHHPFTLLPLPLPARLSPHHLACTHLFPTSTCLHVSACLHLLLRETGPRFGGGAGTGDAHGR